MKKGYYGARNFASKFYKGKAWKKRSRDYRQTHPLCERCLKKGLYVPAECVHHKIHITEENQYDQQILLGEANLESLCRQCHAEEHSQKESVKFGIDGRLIL